MYSALKRLLNDVSGVYRYGENMGFLIIETKNTGKLISQISKWVNDNYPDFDLKTVELNSTTLCVDVRTICYTSPEDY